MVFYDHFITSKTSGVSKIGEKIINWQNNLFLDLIRKFSNKKLEDINLLEIGPGKGYFARKCKKFNINYSAIEANEKMADDLKKSGFKNIYQDMAPPIKTEQKFDVIFMDQVFEHMLNFNKAIDLINSCRDRLNKNGLLIISSPDYQVFKEDFFNCDYTHSYPTSVMRLSQILNDGDFKVIYRNYYSFLNKGFIHTRIISFLSKLLYNIGIFKIIFREKAYKIKVSLLSSCIIIGKKE